MGIEAIAIILSFMGAAVLLVLIGRLFWIVLKIALVGIFLWLLLTRVYPIFKPQADPRKGTLTWQTKVPPSLPSPDSSGR